MKKRLIAAAVGVLVATAAFAGDQHKPSSSQSGPVLPQASGGSPNTYGASEIAAYYSAAAFIPRDSSIAYFENAGDKVITAAGGSSHGLDFAGHISLPAGAVIDSVDIFVCDTDVTNEMTAFLTRYDTVAGHFTDVASGLTSGSPGCGPITLTPSSTETVDNNSNAYNVIVRFGAATASLSLRGARVHYHLQVSPAPAVATFTDVPLSDSAFQFIEAFNGASITVGCQAPADPPAFCPDGFVTRRQMAVFFAKALGLHFAP